MTIYLLFNQLMGNNIHTYHLEDHIIETTVKPSQMRDRLRIYVLEGSLPLYVGPFVDRHNQKYGMVNAIRIKQDDTYESFTFSEFDPLSD